MAGEGSSSHIKEDRSIGCSKCGQPHLKCWGHRQKTNRPCPYLPMKGQHVCRKCGGSTPAAKRKVERAVTQAKVMRTINDYLERNGIPAVHPLEALLDQVDWTGAFVRLLRQFVGALPRTQLIGPDHNLDARPHVLTEMLRVWSDQHAKVCKMALDAGIDSARLALATSQTDVMFEAMLVGLKALDLAPEQVELFNTVVAEKLHALVAKRNKELDPGDAPPSTA